ncbi:MAG: TonB-dependent receptor [Bacteroidota bacterium]
MYKSTLLVLFTSSSLAVTAQVTSTDSVKKLNEITVNGYYNAQSLLRSTAAVSLIDTNQFKNQANASLVSLTNTAAGVRMEERSPGSYRLSLRGSLLRSPFGIRNIKIYIDDFPLTDAGGNTYLNALDVGAIRSMEIYKGPEASIFGANTGGAILLKSPLGLTNGVELAITGGSYGLFHQTASLQQTYKNYNFNFTQGYQQSEGYRENSALDRKFIQTTQHFSYSAKAELKAFLFYSDLVYETPGGLTMAQMVQNPKMARPATSTLPGAIAQQAAIYNRTFFAGLSHTYNFSTNFRHVIALFTSYTDFKNPFITNFEKRKESNLGLRTFFDFYGIKPTIKWSAQLGLESATAKSKISNFNNDGGTATSLIAKDDLQANQSFAFLRLNFDLQHRLLIELASSLNFYGYHYQSYFPTALAQKQVKLSTQLMPKLAVSYLLNPALSIRASISKGYSPPTLAEIRSSDNNINNKLQPEYGWNYEAGVRFKSIDSHFYLNANLFSYQLTNAIVRRLHQNDTEYFINAGGTKQQGLEVEAAVWLLPIRPKRFLAGLQLRNSYTYSKFNFKNFINAASNFSGNKLTGVPDHTVISSLEFLFKKGVYFFAQHNFTSAIPLNDANTVKAAPYHLVDLKAGINSLKIKKNKLELFVGINNLFDEKYSLGNDLNAGNGRYFNPAAMLNFYSGLNIRL